MYSSIFDFWISEWESNLIFYLVMSAKKGESAEYIILTKVLQLMMSSLPILIE